MARNPQQIDRAAEFLDRHAQRAYLVDERSLAILKSAIEGLQGKTKFSLEHIQAFTLAISMCEAQIRDCIRLAFDALYIPIDTNNPLMKDVNLDYTLLNSVRDRHFSVGEFFALNISISTISRFLAGAELGFPGLDLASRFGDWDLAKSQNPPVTFDDLKASLAFVFEERNRYVHEFSELIAANIGSPHDNERLLVPLRLVFLLLRFIQHLKESQHSRTYGESHPSRGRVGKALNELSAKIRDELDELDAIIRNSNSDPRLPEALDVRRATAALQSAHNEYLFRLGRFIRYTYGQGTIVPDIIWGTTLEALQQFEETISWGLSLQRERRKPIG
jgi:hypothetical protein